MSVGLIPSLQTLPVEILYHILHDLDSQTILFSFRNTCRRFRAVVDDYDHYNLNGESISKPDFELLCRLAEPHRIISLTLSQNDETLDQIKIFLSYFKLQQFNRLRSLSLFITEEVQLKTITERFSIRSLESFTLKIEKSDDRRKTTTARHLSSIIAKSNLSKLELHIQDGRLEKIVWPAQCSIQHLRVNNTVSFDIMCTIFRCLPHLRTLIVSSLSIRNYQPIVLPPSFLTLFRSLTSLTLLKVSTEIDDLERFLSLTSSLVHLKLIGYGKYCDGNRWEQFIQSRLPLLNKFEFFFTEGQNTQQGAPDIKTIIEAFQTPFWVEDKKWFVTCESDINPPRYITLYSIPVCVSYLAYETKKISISTFPKINDEDMSIMDNVDTVRLNFSKLVPLDMEKKENTTNHPLFRKLKRLELEFDTNRPIGWIEFVSDLIDLKTIVQIKVSSKLIQESHPHMLADMAAMLKKTSNVSSFDICFGFLSRKSWLTAAEICSMIPLDVKHLAVSVKNLDEIKKVFERLQHLSSANFFFDYTPSSNEIIQWLDSKRNRSSYQVDSFTVCVWLGKSIIQPKEAKVGNKRIKLTDEHHL